MCVSYQTWKSERLTITDFDGPYFTHGLGIHYVPSIPNEMWIHAVNHIPSQSCFPPSGSPSHPDCISESRVEIFLHDPTESPGTARHIKTVRHPLISLVVGIDPKKSGNGGSARREGWLMVTGPYSKAVGVLKVEL